MKEENNPNNPWWQSGLQLFLRLSGWIGGPIIVAVFVGKLLDEKYHTTPWLFLTCVGASFIVSMIALIRIGFREFKKIEKENNQTPRNNTKKNSNNQNPKV